MIEIKLTKEYYLPYHQVCIFGEIICDEPQKFRDILGEMPPPHNRVAVVLRYVFQNHRNLYEALGFQYNQNHHPGDYDFTEGCDGFKTFMREHYNIPTLDNLEDKALEKLVNVASMHLNKRIVDINSLISTKLEFSSKISFPEPDKATPQPPFTDPQFFNNSILITDSGNYQLTLAKTTGNSLLDIERSITDLLRSSYGSQLDSKLTSLKNEISLLKSEIKNTKITSFTEGIKCAQQIDTKWKVDGNRLVYKKKIYAKQVKRGNILYELPPETETYFISNLSLEIGPTISNAFCKTSHHPNAVIGGVVCMGDLENKPILEVLTKLPESLQTINMDSAFNNSATSNVLYALGTGEFKQTSEIWKGDSW